MSGIFLTHCATVCPIQKKPFPHRHGFQTRYSLEDKSWLAQVVQANLYSDRTQEALEAVKVVNTIPSIPRGTNKSLLVPPKVCRRSNRNLRLERLLTRARNIGESLSFEHCGAGGHFPFAGPQVNDTWNVTSIEI